MFMDVCNIGIINVADNRIAQQPWEMSQVAFKESSRYILGAGNKSQTDRLSSTQQRNLTVIESDTFTRMIER